MNILQEWEKKETQCTLPIHITANKKNPAANELTIQFNVLETGNVNIDVFDAIGQLVKSKVMKANPGINNAQFSIKNLSEGLYIVRISGEKFSNSNQFIKLK